MIRLKLALFSVLVAFTLLFGVAFFGSLEVDAQGGMTVFNGMRLTTFIRFQPRTAITVTQDLDVNATGTYQRLTAAGAVGTASVTIKPAGTYLILVNVGANSITITETALIKSAGNIVLGQYDSATLLSDGTNWFQVAASNN